MTATSLSVSATALGVREVTGAFDAFSAAHRIALPVAQAVQVALDELLSNTVRSAFPPGQNGRIDVRFDIAEGALDVLIVDDGVPFDPLARADPDTGASLEARPVGGLGIYLVRQLMDSVDYERRGGENRLRLRKGIIKG
jgi:serine/threonine-protein kinase RsbW